MTATLDVIDAEDLEHAVAKVAHDLLLAGSTEPLDVRRALALGEIARHELQGNEAGGHDQQPGRAATLYVHLTATDLDLLHDESGLDQPDAHLERGNTRYSIGIDRLHAWLTRTGTSVSIRPVIDLNTDITSTAYQPTARLREQVILRNPRCVFPHCNRSARAADLDHIDPYEHGGTTTSANLAPLCRLHHRVKTHTGWTYTQLSPGEFLWHSPHAQVFHVDPDGTTPISP